MRKERAEKREKVSGRLDKTRWRSVITQAVLAVLAVALLLVAALLLLRHSGGTVTLARVMSFCELISATVTRASSSQTPRRSCSLDRASTGCVYAFLPCRDGSHRNSRCTGLFWISPLQKSSRCVGCLRFQRSLKSHVELCAFL